MNRTWQWNQKTDQMKQRYFVLEEEGSQIGISGLYGAAVSLVLMVSKSSS